LASRYGITFAQLALVHPTGSISVTDISLVAILRKNCININFLSLPKDSCNTAACASILDDTEVGNEFPCFLPADSFALMLDDEMSNRFPIQANLLSQSPAWMQSLFSLDISNKRSCSDSSLS